MDGKQFESIKAKLETLKTKRAKAEGAIESEKANWKKLYGVETAEELEAMCTEGEEQLETLETKMDTLMEELKGLTNWSLC
jgi:chromosome segregation ATPase